MAGRLPRLNAAERRGIIDLIVFYEGRGWDWGLPVAHLLHQAGMVEPGGRRWPKAEGSNHAERDASDGNGGA